MREFMNWKDNETNENLAQNEKDKENMNERLRNMKDRVSHLISI